MQAIKFKEQNSTFAENQPEYSPLPSFRTKDDIVISCWKMTWKERVITLFTGKIWHLQMTFGKPLQPVAISGIKRKRDFE